jgi:soluble lytic murein transglycosylase
VLDIRPSQAVRLISEGDLDFIFNARPSRLGELLTLHSGAAFYAGLLAEEQAVAFRAESAGGTPEDEAVGISAINAAASARIAEALYLVSLESSSPHVREAAVQKLVPLVLKTGNKDAARRLVQDIQTGTEKESSPEKLLILIDALTPLPAKTERDEAVQGLTAFFLTAQVDEAYRQGWLAINPEFFAGAESAAVTGRLAASRSSFAEALASFRKTLEEDESLFLRYPALLNDLGRAFQFSSAVSEGAALFREWEERITADTTGISVASETRYLLPYFAGRMARRLGRTTEAVEAFTRALDAAPDPAQEDACMWYILEITQSADPESLIPLVKTYLPRWHSPSYFDDILERQARYFSARGQWNGLLEIYSLFPKESGWAARGQYGYILGRAVSLGFPVGDSPPESAAEFFQAAWEEPAAAFYYRALAGLLLKAPPLVFPEERNPGPTRKKPAARVSPASLTLPDPKHFPHQDVMEFLLGFFRYGVAGHITPYLQNFQEELTVDELRALAEAFYRVERWNDAMRLMTICKSRQGYTFTQGDLELSFPRPFQELTEAYAQEADIPAPLLYGLIRTESAFDPGIYSRVGAIGLTQLMTATAQDMAARLSRQGGPQYARSGEINLKDPETNIHLGAIYLRYLMDTLKRPMPAVLAYNGGMGRVRRWRQAAEKGLPDDLFLETIDIFETRDYGRKVFGAAAVYGYLYYDIPMEDIVADIIK